MSEWASFEEFLQEAQQTAIEDRQALVDALLQTRQAFPWIQGNQATFIVTHKDAKQAALNIDTIKRDPPLLPMDRLEGTDLFHTTTTFKSDDLLDYLLAIDDPMTPLATETQLLQRVHQHWKTDQLNPLFVETANLDVSVIRMPKSRPFLDWSALKHVPHGTTETLSVPSVQLSHKYYRVWVHLPPNYASSSQYPLLILQDGQWMLDALQVTAIADTLVKHHRMQPTIIAMVESGDQQTRIVDYQFGSRYYTFVMTELLPVLQERYPIDTGHLVCGGVSIGAIAAAVTVTENPGLFSGLLMLSPPLGESQDTLQHFLNIFETSTSIPEHIFQSVGRYEIPSRFYRPAQILAQTLQQRADTRYKFLVGGSGHGMSAFRSVMPEALAWTLPYPEKA